MTVIYKINTSTVTADLTIDYEVPTNQLAEISERIMIPAVAQIRMHMHITPVDEKWELTGSVDADVQLECVQSHRRFDASFHVPFQVILTPIEFDTDMDIEILESETIDIGDIAIQYLALEIPLAPLHPDLEDSAQNKPQQDVNETATPSWKDALSKLTTKE